METQQPASNQPQPGTNQPNPSPVVSEQPPTPSDGQQDTQPSSVVYAAPVSNSDMLARESERKARNFPIIITIVVISLLAIGGGTAAYFYVSSSTGTSDSESRAEQPVTETTKTPEASKTPPPEEKVAQKQPAVVPSGWKEYTFTDNAATVSFWYPSDWQVQSYNYTSSMVYTVTSPSAAGGHQVGFTIRAQKSGGQTLEQQVASLPGSKNGNITEKESRKVRDMEAIEYLNYGKRSIDINAGNSVTVGTSVKLGDSSKQSADYETYNKFVNSIAVK